MGGTRDHAFTSQESDVRVRVCLCSPHFDFWRVTWGVANRARRKFELLQGRTEVMLREGREDEPHSVHFTVSISSSVVKLPGSVAFAVGGVSVGI